MKWFFGEYMKSYSMKKTGITVLFRAFFSLLSVAVFVCSAVSGSGAFAENKAEYLTAGLHYSPSGISQRKLIIDCVKQKARNSNELPLSDPESIKRILSSSSETAEDEAFGFIADAAVEQNAVYAGTFLNSSGCAEQYSFLTEVNGFTEHAAEKCFLSECGMVNIYPGDILFWLDGSGRPVNASLVCEQHESYVTAAMFEQGKGCILVKLNREILEGLGDFSVVHPDYAYNESLIYLYCVNTLHYTRSGACGVVANVHFESSSVSVKEEHENSIGYGICQWSFERRENLEKYCLSHGLDVSLLESQLEFMGYELDNDFKFTGDFLRTAPETENGAYDSGYWFCFEYEQPYDFEKVSEKRAELSLDLWRKLQGA